MLLKTEKIGNKVVIRILKNLDTLQAGEEFKSVLMDLYSKGEKEIVIDFGNTNLINSHGIGKILMFYRRLKESGGKMYITPLKGNIKDIFESLLLDQLLTQIQI